MQIGELAGRSGATVRMLRYYEDQGLLRPRRTPGGYRVYDEDDVDRMARIRCMLSAALPSTVIGAVLDYLRPGGAPVTTDPQQRSELAADLTEELARLDERIAALNQSRALMAVLLTDVRDGAVGLGRPGEPGAGPRRRTVRVHRPARRSA
jgi:DNA-binding transcriptional MerR regulator